ncbi:MAG: hypothetical protein R3C45_00785 [Phycisphaerales bacterium]
MLARVWLAAFLVFGFTAPCGALNIVLNYDNGQSSEPGTDPTGAGLISLFQYAETYYQDIFDDSHTLTINFWYTNLSGNLLGQHTLEGFDGTRETEGNIRIDNGTAWFIDPTPSTNVEFNMQQTLWRDINSTQRSDWYNGAVGIAQTFEVGFGGTATAGGGANGLTDMLTVILHEVGHALGMASDNDTTDAETGDGDYDFNTAYVNGVTLAVETANNSGDDGLNIAHLESNFALMNPSIPNSTRILPSHTDLFAMAAGNAFNALDVPRRELYNEGSWNSASLWSGNQVPASNDDAFVRDARGDGDLDVSLSAAGFANNLTVAEGADVATNGFKLDASNIVTLTDPASSITVGTGGELEANQIIVRNSAELIVSGGLVDTSTLTLDSGTTLTGLLGNHTVDVSNSLANNGTIRALLNSTLTFQSTAATPWNLDGIGDGRLEANTGNLFFDTGGLLGAFQGDMQVGAGHYIRIDAAWTNQGDIELNGGADFANRARLIGGTITQNTGGASLDATGLVDIDAPMLIQGGSVRTFAGGELNLNGATTITGGNFSLYGGATMDVNGPLTLSGGFFSGSGPSGSGGYTFDGTTTYNGGTIQLAAIIQQNGNASVASDTTIQNGYLDMDGAAGTAQWTINAALTLSNISGIENVTTNNTFNGTININNAGALLGGGGLLNVNFATPGTVWTMAGTLNLDGSLPGTPPFFTVIPTMIDGDDVNISGTLNMQDRGLIAARVNLSGTANILTTGSSLTLTGGNIANPNTMTGALVTGAGKLRATDGRALVGSGTINSDIEFVDNSHLRAAGGTLVINGTILDVGTIGTADSGGNLQVNNVWNTNIADAVDMQGGAILGANIINGTVLDPGLIIGFGTLAPNQVVNDGKIAAKGGTLVINTVLNPDLDGGGNAGIIEAVQGNLSIFDTVTDLFDGTANVGPGRNMFFNGGWTLGNGTLNLNGGSSSVEAATIGGLSQSLRGTVNVDQSALFDIPTTFTPTVTVNLPDFTDILRLDQDATVQAGANFIGLGILSNLSGSTLTLNDGADVTVKLMNNGVLEIGASPGHATVEVFTQVLGKLHIELGGLTAGTQYDQLTVLGNATLSGTLDVSLLGQFVPSPGDSFAVIPFEGNRLGAFDSVSLPILAGIGMGLVYESDTVKLLTGLIGDLNFDGFVGIADLNIVLGNWNQGVDAGVWGLGDPTGDGFVGIADLNTVLGNWNVGTPPSDSANIPEPGSSTLLSILAASALYLRRSQ